MGGKNTVPGSDGVPDHILAAALRTLGQRHLRILSGCMSIGRLLVDWKRAKLVLIPIPGKDLNTHSGYRPICLLNDVGKLFNLRIVVTRITRHLTQDGPDMAEHQYDFRTCVQRCAQLIVCSAYSRHCLCFQHAAMGKG